MTSPSCSSRSRIDRGVSDGVQLGEETGLACGVGIHPMVPMPIVTYSLQGGLAGAPPRPWICHTYQFTHKDTAWTR